MKHRDHKPTLEQILSQLGPYVEGSGLKRSRLEQVLNKSGVSLNLRRSTLQDLEAAGILLIEDVDLLGETVEQNGYEVAVPEERPVTVDHAPAVQAAKRRLARDRRMEHRRLQHQLLSAQEEVGLGLIVRGEDGKPLKQGEFARLTGERREAAEAMVLHNLGLVHAHCKRFALTGMEYDDLFQSSMPGLIRAVELFDPTSGNKFSTYATHWIRQSLSRGVANESRLVRLPVHMFERVQKVRAVQAKLAVGEHSARLTDIAEECQLTVPQVIECLRLSRQPAYLDAEIGDDGFTLGDVIDRHAERPEYVEVQGFTPHDVRDWVDRLTEREADIVLRRFGLSPYDEAQTLETIGIAYGLTRERIRQIEAKAMERLREIVRQ